MNVNSKDFSPVQRMLETLATIRGSSCIHIESYDHRYALSDLWRQTTGRLSLLYHHLDLNLEQF